MKGGTVLAWAQKGGLSNQLTGSNKEEHSMGLLFGVVWKERKVA